MSINPNATETPWTFKVWIANFKGVDLPIGDLANDISDDPDFPEDDNFCGIQDYLHGKTSDAVVIETFKSVWNFYLASR